MNTRSRMVLLVFQIFIASLFLALIGRLFYLQVAAGPKYKDAALSIQSRDVVTLANRGLIVDGYGVPLASNRVGLAVTVNRVKLDKLEDKGVATLTKIADLLGLKYSDVWQTTRLCGELAKGERTGCWKGSRYQPIPITRDADPQVALQIVERSTDYPGIDALPMSMRSYPGIDGVNAAHVLGYTGSLTEEDLATGKYFRSETIGKSGLELQYDKYLRGIPGVKTVIVDRKESVTRTSQNTKPISGKHLVTSLDVRLQASTDSALKDAVLRARASGYRADGGAAIVMDIKTGRILAISSYPTYDPNQWSKGLTVQEAKDLFSEKKGVPALNRPLQGLYAPASTFKSLSVIAAKTAGYSLNGSYDCPAQVEVGTRTFRNYESKAAGRLTMKKAIAISCDTVWYTIAYREWLKDGGLKPKNPKDYFFNVANGFQISKKTGIDLPAESAGRVPDRAWKERYWESTKDFYCNYKERAAKSALTPFLILLAQENCLDGMKVRAGDAVNFAIGQGDTVLTPLKMAQMYAAIGNGGKLWQPTVAKAIVTTDGKVLRAIEPKIVGTIPADKETLDFLNSALHEVTISGTAAGVFSGFPVKISGKTGTAEVIGRTKKDNTSWFASFGPTDAPRYAVVMMVSQGGFGASTSAVGVRKIYSTLFGVEGNKLIPNKALFPKSGPPSDLPKISPATKPKVVNESGTVVTT